MVVLETIAVAFSMFSAIPMPRVEWNARNQRYCLCAFPLIGVVIGGFCWLWVSLCSVLSFPMLLRGAGLCVIPVLITGGIHLDGYADTSDALASHSSPAKKREILKDPHLGTFAVIRICVFFILSLSFWTAIPHYQAFVAIGIFGLSRALSALSLTCFPLAEGSGLARAFAERADRNVVRAVCACLAVLFAVLIVLCGGWLAIPAGILILFRYYRMAKNEFDGVSGDLAGWFLQTAELWMLGAWCIQIYLEKLL